ncbi:MAG: hypothetical protein M1457_13330, partial [bacterium]|nr:hypothetical protein [bacterium]
RRRRATAARQAWEIVEEELGKYRATIHMARIAPLIKRLSEHFDRIFDEEDSAIAPIEGGSPSAGQLQSSHRRIKQRLLHEVIQELKSRLVQGA